MSLLDAFKSKVVAAERTEEEVRLGLWQEYRGLLERAEHPQKADAERLLELVDLLNIDPREVELHLVVLEDEARIKPEADALEDNAETARKANELVEKRRAENDASILRGESAYKLAREAEEAVTRSRAQRETQTKICGEYPALFGSSADPIDGDATPNIQAARRRLGLANVKE